MNTPFDQLPPSSQRLGAMIAERADIVTRIGHFEAENARLQATVNRSAAARLFSSPPGIVAIVLALVLGVVAGGWMGNADARGKSFMGTLF